MCVYPNYCDKDYPCPGHSDCVNNQCVCKTGYRWVESNVFPPTVEVLRKRSPCEELNPCDEDGDSLCQKPLYCKHVGPGKHTCVCQVRVPRKLFDTL